MADDTPTPLWQKIAALVFVIAWAALIIVWHGRASADLWPLDSSRVGPNLVASFILFSLGTVAAALIWPPTRRRMHQFVDKKLDKVHEKLDRHHREAAEDRKALHAKIDGNHKEHLAAVAQLHRRLDDAAHPVKPVVKKAPVKKTVK
jgi:hypothetical protein